jgi:replicative DNA helicase
MLAHEAGAGSRPLPAGRQVPRALDAEAALLGGVIVDGRALAEIVDTLRPSDFYDAKHEGIYDAMLSLWSQSAPIELVSVAAEMRKRGTFVRLGAVGQEAYLVGLANSAGPGSPVAHHAQLVREASTRRALAATGSALAARAVDPELAPEALLDDGQRALFELAGRAAPQSYVSAREVVKESILGIEKRFERKQAVSGVPSGFSELDGMTAGLQPGDLIIVAARPSMGKTAFAMGCAMHAAVERSIPTLVFSLEMSKASLGDRLLGMEARIASDALRTGYLQTGDFIRLSKAAARIAAAPMSIDDSGEATLMQIRAKVRRWRTETAALAGGAEGLGLVVVDYLQLVTPDPSRRRNTSNREQEISMISRGLKALAKEAKVPIVALAQLNRALEGRADKRPMLSDLRESGAIEQDADLISFLYRDDYYHRDSKEPGVAEVIIGKQRNGPTGTVKLTWVGAYTRFENLSTRERP